MLDVKHHYYSLMWHYREREKKEEDFCYQARAIFDIKASSVICKCRYLPPLLFWHCKVDFVTAAKLPPGFADCRIKVVTAEFTLQLEICVCSFDFALATMIFYWICICSSQTVAATASDKVRDGSGWDKGCVILWSVFEWINENFHTHTHTHTKKILACSQRVYRYPFSETIGASSADLCLLFYYRAAATLLVQCYFTSADSVRTISMRDVHDFSAVPLPRGVFGGGGEVRLIVRCIFYV